MCYLFIYLCLPTSGFVALYSFCHLIVSRFCFLEPVPFCFLYLFSMFHPWDASCHESKAHGFGFNPPCNLHSFVPPAFYFGFFFIYFHTEVFGCQGNLWCHTSRKETMAFRFCLHKRQVRQMKTIGFGDNLQFGFPHKFLAKPLLHIEHLKCRAIEKLAFPLIFFATRFAISIYNRNNNSEMNNNAPCWQAITNGIGFLLLQFVCSTSSHMPHPLLTPQHTHWFLLVAQWSKNLVQRRK